MKSLNVFLCLAAVNLMSVTRSVDAHNLEPLRVADNGRMLVAESGRPFIWVADTAWALHQNVSRKDVRFYLDDAKAQGFTVVQLFSANRWALDDYRNFYGETPYIDEDPARINPDYWSHTRWVIEEAGKRGLYIYLVYGSPGRKDEGMPYAKTPQQAYDYGFGVGSALKGLPNLLWAGGMDNDPTDTGKLAPMGFEGWHAMAEGINDGVAGARAYDVKSDYSRTLMTYHVNGQNVSMPYFHDAPWLDFNMGQLGLQQGSGDDTVLVSRTFECYRKTPTKPFYSLEPWYENNTWRKTPVNDHEVRIQAYQSLMAGAAGIAYGNKNLWAMSRPRASDRDAWKKALGDPGRSQMKYVRTFLERYPHNKVPDFDHQLVIASDNDCHKSLKLKARIGAAHTEDRTKAFVYSPQGHSFVVNMDFLVGDKTVAAWYDTRSGTMRPADATAAGMSKMIPPSAGTDWLLIVERD